MKINKTKRIIGWLVGMVVCFWGPVFSDELVILKSDEGEEIIGIYEFNENLDKQVPDYCNTDDEDLLISKVLDEYEILKDERELGPIDPFYNNDTENSIIEISEIEPEEIEDANIISEEELSDCEEVSIYDNNNYIIIVGKKE